MRCCCAILLFCYDVLSFCFNILSFCYAIPSFSYSSHSLLFLPKVQLCGSVVLLGYFVSIFWIVMLFCHSLLPFYHSVMLFCFVWCTISAKKQTCNSTSNFTVVNIGLYSQHRTLLLSTTDFTVVNIELLTQHPTLQLSTADHWLNIGL